MAQPLGSGLPPKRNTHAKLDGKIVRTPTQTIERGRPIRPTPDGTSGMNESAVGR
jgi:hypothetical protein